MTSNIVIFVERDMAMLNMAEESTAKDPEAGTVNIMSAC